jgi:anti-sigma regulatory factor (Ser/Thr protein kinase)
MRAVETIKTGTTIYTALTDVIVNAIQAIEEKEEANGKVTVIVERSAQAELDGGLPEIVGFEIRDNGVGFTERNKESFDTLYSDQKLKRGGKGFGRFVCLKYFDELSVESVYEEEGSFKRRTFTMGKRHDIIENLKTTPSKVTESYAIIYLKKIRKDKFPDKKLETVARNLVEKLLPYFITDGYRCPAIEITEQDRSGTIILNDFVNGGASCDIHEIYIPETTFTLTDLGSDREFRTRVFKFYNPRSQKSKISLVAHQQQVTDTPIYHYIPEFSDEFCDQNEDTSTIRNFIVKAYVFGDYLDEHVSLERGGFDFKKDEDTQFGISQKGIEESASEIAQKAVGDEIRSRQEKKRETVDSYVEEKAPWHRDIAKDLDLSTLPYQPSHEEIELKLQTEKFKREVSIGREVSALLATSSLKNSHEDVTKIVEKISGTSKNDLVHYVALRKYVLDLFEKSLECNSDGTYSSEGIVHDIIFPRRNDSEATSFENHNLWLLDERLNFTRYISSDLPLNGPHTDRPDLIVYDRLVAFRGDNRADNPVTIFEFKRPQRDDFVNPSAIDNPIDQIIRYVNMIRDGEFKTPKGRDILIGENTPFYGYAVCDLTEKVKRWLHYQKNFKPMPDRRGWFQWYESINLYIEVLSWDKVLSDANMRNEIFFSKLGI